MIFNKKARFHSSMIDTKMLKAGQGFKEIHDSYVIFITASGVMGVGRSLYYVNKIYVLSGAGKTSKPSCARLWTRYQKNKSLAGAFGIPEWMPPVRQRDF